ncbi:MAG: hypothetical protein ABSF38_05820 [Verrucomicrobiota bacterium]
MKKLIIAWLAAAALVSLSACSTSKEAAPAPMPSSTSSSTVIPNDTPLITDPHVDYSR